MGARSFTTMVASGWSWRVTGSFSPTPPPVASSGLLGETSQGQGPLPSQGAAPLPRLHLPVAEPATAGAGPRLGRAGSVVDGPGGDDLLGVVRRHQGGPHGPSLLVGPPAALPLGGSLGDGRGVVAFAH